MPINSSWPTLNHVSNVWALSATATRYRSTLSRNGGFVSPLKEATASSSILGVMPIAFWRLTHPLTAPRFCSGLACIVAWALSVMLYLPQRGHVRSSQRPFFGAQPTPPLLHNRQLLSVAMSLFLLGCSKRSLENNRKCPLLRRLGHALFLLSGLSCSTILL